MKDDSIELQKISGTVGNFDMNGKFKGTPYQWLPLINQKQLFQRKTRGSIISRRMVFHKITLYQPDPKDEEIIENLFDYKTTYAQLACLCGSINCLKFLIMNGAVLKGTMKYAIAGGNIEIIRLVEKSVESDNGWIKMALYSIKYHRNNIFDWILEAKINSNANDFANSCSKLRQKCILSDNWYAYNQLKEKKLIED